MQYKYEIIKNQDGLPIRVSIKKVIRDDTHWHNAIEIVFVLQGSISIRIGNNRYLLKENDLILINSNEMHSAIKESDDNIIAMLQINMDFYVTFYPQLKNYYFDCKSFESNETEQIKYRRTKKYIAKITWELSNKNKGYPLKIVNETNSLLIYLLDHFECKLLDDKSLLVMNKDIQKLMDMIDYINRNIVGSVTLQDIANNMSLSTYYVSHFFKDKMGISFQDFLRNLRMDKAINLLLYTDKRITEIAYDSGFSDIKSMNHYFRKAYGCTPTEFRQKKDDSLLIENQEVNNEKESRTYIDKNAAHTLLYRCLETSYI